MAKFTAKDGTPIHILESGAVLSTWPRGKDEQPGTTITIAGNAHHVLEPLEAVAESLGEPIKEQKPARDRGG